MATTRKTTRKPKRGTCTRCGCTDERACPRGCAWVNAAHTLCTACATDAELEAAARRNGLCARAAMARRLPHLPIWLNVTNAAGDLVARIDLAEYDLEKPLSRSVLLDELAGAKAMVARGEVA